MKKTKILFFLWSFSLGGGAEKILSTIVNNLDSEKYDIDILEIEHFDKGYEPVDDNIRILKSWQDYRQSKLKRAILWRIRKFFPNLVRKIMVKENMPLYHWHLIKKKKLTSLLQKNFIEILKSEY